MRLDARQSCSLMWSAVHADSAAGALQHIRGQLRAAQAARACTRHADRVYGQPLVGPALAGQAAGARAMPELRTVGEEARAAWLQASPPRLCVASAVCRTKATVQ